jgi:hyperosmotically inducible protein
MRALMEVTMFRITRKFSGFIATMIFIMGFAGIGSAAVTVGSVKQPPDRTEQVRLELIKVPNLGVFDNLAFRMESPDTVVLTGQVIDPVVKSGAETAVLRLPGINKVENNIEVLPLSPYDDEIRLKTYYAVYSNTGFEKYAQMAVAPVRIIVRNGHVTLDGVVGNQLEKNMAVLSANTVPGVFSVTDNLRIG